MAEFNQQKQQVNTQVNTGRDAHIDRIGDDVGGDKITVGDITGSYAAIGAGAQVIVTQVQQALSAVDEMEKGVRVAERRLAEAIQRLIGHYTGLTAAGADDRSNPYKSLLDYKLEDAPYFYGRTAAIKGSLDKLAQNRLMVLHSESGSGKTSLLQAGLASRLLSAGHFPLYIRPYRTPPGAAVRRALLPDYRTQPDLARFTDEAMSLRGFLERVTFYLGGRRLYLFLDQFEEFFSEVAREDRETFARELQDCVETDLNARWVLSLRKEYFSDLRLFRSLKPYDNEFFLPTFNIREATEVIIEPAARRGVAYENGLVERIVNDLDQGTAGLSPAQVQLVCTTLFDERPEGAATMTHAQYDTPRGRGATGAEGILSSHLSRVLQRELSPPERVVAARALEALVTSEKRRAVKRRDELLAELPPTADADPAQVLKTLVDSRLLRIDEDDASGEDRYELAHDYLLAEIELDPETQARKAAQELLARELVAYDRYGTLLSKERFAIIDSQRAHLALDGKAVELLTRSERELTRQARRKFISLGLIFIAISLIVLRYVALPLIMKSSAANDQHAALVAIDGFSGVSFEAFEVTNERFAKCVDWGPCDQPGSFHLVRPNPSDDFFWYNDPIWLQSRHKPVVEVDAVNAMKFCNWIDRTLPTSEQWSSVSPSRREWKNLDELTALLCRSTKCEGPTSVGKRTNPQYRNAAGNGLFDLVGSVNEWTRTRIDSFDDPRKCTDLDGFEEVVNLVILGENFSVFLEEAGLAYQNVGRSYSSSDQRFEKYGFRCVEDISPTFETYDCPDLK